MARHRYRRFWGRRVADELDAELRFHLEMGVADLVARGMPADEAERHVRARLGDLGAIRQECLTIDHRIERREARHHMFQAFLHDLRLAARSLTRQRTWTMVVVATLALGIGANSALFSIVNAILLRSLPYPDADRIVSISEAYEGRDASVVAGPVVDAWRAEAQSFAALAVYSGHSTIMRGPGDPEIVNGRQVTHDYFAVLGLTPAIGRAFAADEDVPGSASVIILSDRLWRRMFGGDSAIVGGTVHLDGTPATVVGIMPSGATTAGRTEYWIPLRRRPTTGGSFFYYQMLGRLRPDRTIDRARAELAAIQRRVNATRGAAAQTATPVVTTLHERRYGDTRPALLMLFAAVGVLLLIACANVANLILARTARREGELAVRVALGASRGRLVRYLLAESVLLTGVGGILALVLAQLTVGSVVRMAPPVIANTAGLGVDWMVVGFTAAIAIGTGLVFALIPAMVADRTPVNRVLAQGSGRTSGGARQHWARRILVVAQLATALVLLTGAGLLAKSFATVMAIDPGIDMDRILIGTVDLSRTRYRGDAATMFYGELLQQVRAIPGVEAAAITDAAPLQGVRMSTLLRNDDGTPSHRFDVSAVGDDFFRTVGMRLLAGRTFLPSDGPDAAAVAVVNETMARLLSPSGDAVGQELPLGADARMRIVGIVSDVRQRGIEAEIQPTLYRPLAQDGVGPYMQLVIRTTNSVGSIQSAVRDVMRRLDPTQPPATFQTPAQIIADSVTPRRFTFVLLGTFALLSALLAAIGLYGVLSYLVAERTREIGIRAALGADRARVLWLVMGEGLWLAGLGLVLGLIGSLGAVRVLRSLLFQVSIYDPWMFAAGGVVLVLVALMACGLPAVRATRVDPATALRVS